MPTMRMRLVAAALLAGLALVVGGCGGSSSKEKQTASGGPSGAEVIPATASAYVSINTDLDSAQLKQADALSKKFPGRAKALADMRKGMAKDGVDFERDVRPALGPEIDVAWLDFADNGTNIVAVTQPKDEAKFAALLKKANKNEKDKVYSAKVGDWTALADSPAKLERLKSAQNGAKLADAERFKDAIADLPADAIVKAYLNGQNARQAILGGLPGGAAANGALAGTPLQKLNWASAATTAESNGLRLAAGAKSGSDAKTYKAELVDALPAGAYAYYSFNDLASNIRQAMKSLNGLPGFGAKRGQFEQAFGFSVENDLLPLFSGEGAVALYPGPGGGRIPIVDFVLKVKDEAKARRVLQRVGSLAQLGNVGTVRPVKIGGVTGFELRPSGSSVALYYAVAKSLVIVTDSRSALGSIGGGGGKKLADDPLFKAARSGAKASDDTTGFLYVNLHAMLPWAFTFVPPTTPASDMAEVRANTKPLQSLFFSGTRDGDVTRVGGFLEIE
jgi:putative component of toxin-antitoxin plasmid stabilization module